MANTIMVTFRLSKKSKAILAALAKRLRVSRTATLELLLSRKNISVSAELTDEEVNSIIENADEEKQND